MSSSCQSSESSAPESSTRRGVHLIVLIHGLYGNPSNLAVVKEELERAALRRYDDLASPASLPKEGGGDGDEDEVEDLLFANHGGSPKSSSSTLKSETSLRTRLLVLQSFKGGHTWDGIDINAHRAAKEVDGEIARLKGQSEDVEVFSVMGYSLGGLVARYLVGLLHARQPSSFFEHHRPGSFTAFATPHVGVLRYGSRINTIVHTVGRHLFSRSGRQLYRLDHTAAPEPTPRGAGTDADADANADTNDEMHDKQRRPLLSVLADPEHVFIQALALFPRIKVVANGCNDLTVPYPTGAISLTDPYVDHEHRPIHLDLDRDGCIVSHRHIPQTDAVPHPDLSVPGALRKDVRSKNLSKTKREVHRLPPIFHLPLPWPLNYLGFLLVPLLLPLFLCYALVTLWLHTRQSESRTRTEAASTTERTPLLTRPSSRTSTGTGCGSGTATPRSKAATTVPRPNERNSEKPTTTLVNRIPLLLDDDQREMIHHLNTHLPQLERVITWWPWCFNTHAMLIVRAAKRFAYQEEGRGVVRRWAEWAVDEDCRHPSTP